MIRRRSIDQRENILFYGARNRSAEPQCNFSFYEGVLLTKFRNCGAYEKLKKKKKKAKKIFQQEKFLNLYLENYYSAKVKMAKDTYTGNDNNSQGGKKWCAVGYRTDAR